MRALSGYLPAETVNDAPWQEVMLEGDALDLKLPIPLHFEVDAAPYITAGQIAARDPETGIDTIGFHRLMLKERISWDYPFILAAECLNFIAVQRER